MSAAREEAIKSFEHEQTHKKKIATLKSIGKGHLGMGIYSARTSDKKNTD